MMKERQKKIRPVFHQVPKWLGAYNRHGLTTNSPQFHYYSSRNNSSQPVTLYVSHPDQSQPQPMTMYYNIESLLHSSEPVKDETKLKDFSYLDMVEKEQQNKISVSQESIVRDSSWVRKYEPKRFIDLLSDQLINRNVLTWLKSWDEIVFHKKVNKVEPSGTFFKRGNNPNRSNFIFQDFNYKKLILLAGPPGCGKTTLARVVARHCGYHYEEINASDDRSGKSLITKIDNLVTNKTVGRQQKPVCVIIDEVDGALDSDSNGIKEVLQYIESGIVPENPKKVKAEKPQRKSKPEPKVLINKEDLATVEKEERKTKIDRPVIFICNDPFVRGLKELRGKAIVVYFNQLQEDRVVRRLKEITEREGVYVQNQLLTKICVMCNCDVRSSVGVLQLLLKFKKSQGLSPRDVLNRLKFAFAKDSVTSSNQFLQKLNSSKNGSERNIFKSYQYYLQQHPNPSLLFETYYHNLLYHKQIFFRLEAAIKLYGELRSYDVKVHRNHGQIDEFSMMPYLFFKISFKPDEHKKIEFPSAHFEKLNRTKNNQALLQKLRDGIPPYLKVFTSFRKLVREDLYLWWLTMQTSSTKEEDVLRCVYKMLTYGVKLGPRGGQFIFNPEIDQLLTFGHRKPEVALSSATRTLMEENYQFLKLKSQLMAQSSLENRQSYETVINQLKRNRRRNRHLQGGSIKYKYLQGTGTQIKYELRMQNFFQERKL